MLPKSENKVIQKIIVDAFSKQCSFIYMHQQEFEKPAFKNVIILPLLIPKALIHQFAPINLTCSYQAKVYPLFFSRSPDLIVGDDWSQCRRSSKAEEAMASLHPPGINMCGELLCFWAS